MIVRRIMPEGEGGPSICLYSLGDLGPGHLLIHFPESVKNKIINLKTAGMIKIAILISPRISENDTFKRARLELKV